MGQWGKRYTTVTRKKDGNTYEQTWLPHYADPVFEPIPEEAEPDITILLLLDERLVNDKLTEEEFMEYLALLCRIQNGDNEIYRDCNWKRFIFLDSKFRASHDPDLANVCKS